MLIDMSPLKTYPQYRKVFFGQLVSFFGSQITYVALPWQLYQLTNSTFQVGLLGLAQLIPLLGVGLIGGAIADRFERRWICFYSELLLAICNVILVLLTISQRVTPGWIYLVGALMAGLNSLHRPAFSALVPQLVKREDMARVSPLNSFPTTFGMIAGPAVGGLLLASVGIKWTYVIDGLTYVFAMAMMLWLPKIDVPGKGVARVNFGAVKEGLQYALSRRDLLGTYLVDMLAMSFAFPNPLFPLLAAQIAGADKIGWYYSSIAIGAMLATLTSGWTLNRIRHGKMITLAAAGWGIGIFFFGLTSQSFLPSLCFLIFAGWSDMVSGIFRGTVWNQTIPADRRGRLASVEMLSYASGPLIGNSFMGFMADAWGASTALMVGGTLAATSCMMLGRALPPFWLYKAKHGTVV
jgi:MFS family permease